MSRTRVRLSSPKGVGWKDFARPARLELTAGSLEGCCSIQLSYGRIQVGRAAYFFHFRGLTLDHRTNFVASVALANGDSWHLDLKIVAVEV